LNEQETRRNFIAKTCRTGRRSLAINYLTFATFFYVFANTATECGEYRAKYREKE